MSIDYSFFIFYLLFCSSLVPFHRANHENESNRQRYAGSPKKVAVFGFHTNGNLGDEMENTPFLKKLKEWGCIVHVYSATYLPMQERVHARTVRPFEYADKLYWDMPKSPTYFRKYDLFIVAPGPSPNHAEVPDCNGQIPMVWFGMSLCFEGNGVWMYTKMKQCLALFTAREPYSIQVLRNDTVAKFDGSLPPMMLTGDYSFSFEPVPSILAYWKAFYRKQLLPPIVEQDWFLVFSRVNNLNVHVKIIDEGRTLWFTTIDGKESTVPMSRAVFATSDIRDDTNYFASLEKDYKVPPGRLIALGSVEAMWALISISKHVYTDRYHPGVSTFIQQVPITIFKYDFEDVKMRGLHMMQQYTPAQIRQMNQEGFEKLKQVVESSSSILKTLGLRGADATNESNLRYR